MSSGSRQGPTSDPQSRRDQIVEAAFELLATTPLARLSTRAIASAVGVTQPALFRHFASREDLLVAVVDTAKAELEAVVGPLLGSGDPPLRICLRIGQQLAAYIDRRPGLPRLLFADLARETPELRLALERLLTKQRSVISSLVRLAIGDGSARPDVDPAAAATLFVGALQALALDRDLSATGDELTERVPAALALWHAGLATIGPSPAVPIVPKRAQRAAALRLDVRPALERGEEPLPHVLEALRELLPGSVLVLIAPFQPKPLEALLAARGHATTCFAADDGSFNLVCVVGGVPPIVDLRELEPPEPLARVLALAEKLADGAVLLAHLPRYPRLLVPQLVERGFPHEIVELTTGSALLRLEARP